MFQINLAKLSDFDTQVMTLMNLVPDQWVLGTLPTMVCYHKHFGWFERHWIFGVQPLQPGKLIGQGSNRVRVLSWRAQILMRRKVREIKRSAVDVDAPEVVQLYKKTASTPLSSPIPSPIFSKTLMQKFAGGASARGFAALGQQMQAVQANPPVHLLTGLDDHAADAFRYGTMQSSGSDSQDRIATLEQTLDHALKSR